MPCFPHRRWLLTLAIAATGFGSAAIAAQLQSDAAQETIQVQAGEILEILPVHSLPSATYSWILTQDRNFIEVARSAFYNTRLTTPGRFTLNAEVNAPAGHAVLRRIFAIDVLPRRPSSADAGTPPTEPAPSAAPLASALPEPDSDGRIILPQHQELLLLTPLRSDVLPLHLDLDAQNDTDDDGTLTNDNDNAGTFFQTSGTPLHLWFTNAAEQRDITLHADAPDGTPLIQTLSVLPAEYARQRGLLVSRMLITTEERGPKTILFSPQFEDSGAPAIPLVFHWDFGDSTESIEERPLHEFAAYGTYSVRLSVRNIETGKELASRTKAIVLQAPLIHDQRSSAPSPTLPPEPPPPQPSHTSFFRIAFVILGVAVGFAAMGFAVAWAYRAAQAYLLKRKTVAQQPAPLPTPPPPPSPTKIPQSPSSPAPAPTIPPKPASPPKAAPPPPTIPVPAVKKPAPAPAAPDWLKKTAPSAAPPAPPMPPSPKPPSPPPQPPATPPSSTPLPKPPQPPTPAAVRVAPHPNPLPEGEGTMTPAKSPATTLPPAKSPATTLPPKPPQSQLPATPQPPVLPKPPLPPKPQQPPKAPPPAPLQKTVPSPTPPQPNPKDVGGGTSDTVPTPVSDRTIAIVQAENLPPPPKPPAPPSSPPSQPPEGI